MFICLITQSRTIKEFRNPELGHYSLSARVFLPPLFDYMGDQGSVTMDCNLLTGSPDHPVQCSRLLDSGTKDTMKAGRDADERKRDREEWSDCATDSLLDAYEEKWKALNRGNFKSKHWEEVASHVSARGEGQRGMKTPFQCRNKVEQMKKKFKGEKHGKAVSRWPYYSRLEDLLQGVQRDRVSHMPGIPGGMDAGLSRPILLDRDSLGSEEEALGPEDFEGNDKGKDLDEDFDLEEEDDSSSQPRKKFRLLASSPLAKSKGAGSMKGKRLQVCTSDQSTSDIAASLHSFANSILKLEEAKMEMHRDSERLRAEAETRRIEMELKRTEMLLNAQLQITKLLSTKLRKKKVTTKNADTLIQPST